MRQKFDFSNHLCQFIEFVGSKASRFWFPPQGMFASKNSKKRARGPPIKNRNIFKSTNLLHVQKSSVQAIQRFVEESFRWLLCDWQNAAVAAKSSETTVSVAFHSKQRPQNPS
jgi:hypothetical protein